MLGFYTVWRDISTTEHAVRNNVAVYRTIITHYNKSPQRIGKVATVIGVAFKYNSVSGIYTAWQTPDQHGMLSRIIKQHVAQL
jgi:DNA-binding winged helix-turn-helix (wHTH) protein